MSNLKFDECKAKHSDWSDEQVWTAVSLDMESDKVIENKGEDVNPNDPAIIEEIIKGAQSWLKEVLPVIFDKVKAFFNELLSNISVWVKRGLEFVYDYISKYFSPKFEV